MRILTSKFKNKKAYKKFCLTPRSGIGAENFLFESCIRGELPRGVLSVELSVSVIRLFSPDDLLEWFWNLETGSWIDESESASLLFVTWTLVSPSTASFSGQVDLSSRRAFMMSAVPIDPAGGCGNKRE